MIDIITKATTIEIRTVNKNDAITLEMLHNIENIGKEESIVLDAETLKLKEEMQKSLNTKDFEHYRNLSNKYRQILKSCEQGYDFSLHLRLGETPENTYYYFWVNNRIASEKEINFVVNKIKEICKGVELDIRTDNYNLEI